MQYLEITPASDIEGCFFVYFLVVLCFKGNTHAGDIKAMRENLNVSQSVFAMLLNTSISTVQKWEIGDKHPSGPSLKSLNIVKRHGMSALA